MRKLYDHLKDRTRWSWQGLSATWQQEYSFRAWVWANLISALLAVSLPLGTTERALILALGILVLVAELFNTAIERAVDHTSTDHHTLAGQAKDAASAAVALSAVAGCVAWVVILVGLFQA
ncbi:diacylglycerol kinase (ATP) [Ruegeria halocynthiae]|uniref:Diacylglycerol kinase n=1 Tax=Ruegeria halocynthiae TaxID=985054 RepID=A0A1H2VKJ3_9RHOB|nr:diacylglycerol kinase [Ruegeria halocynthiae]SDW68881.1 diacylglycerol kinase (ATP) [Ruegeria halocynthiae]